MTAPIPVKEDLKPALELMERVLREGAPLAPEYPLVFRPGFSGQVVSLGDDEGPRSACTILPRDFVMAGTRLRIGLIGSVSTDPEFRSRGLATQLLGAAEDALREKGCVLSMLWADDPRFYFERGYRPVGWECDFEVPSQARAQLPAADGVRPALEYDRGAIHALYVSHPVRVERSEEETAALLECPDMETLVLVRDGKPVAYACKGRGRDLPGTIHEWAGPIEDVLALLRGHLERSFGENEAGSLYFMVPPSATAMREHLTRLGFERADGILGLAKVIDRAGAARILESKIRPEGSLVIEEQEGATGVYLVGERSGIELDDDGILSLMMPAHGMHDEVRDLADAFGLTFDGLPILPFCWGLDSI